MTRSLVSSPRDGEHGGWKHGGWKHGGWTPGAPEKRSRNRTATALTEFALCLPILLLIMSAIIEFGFMLNASMQIQDAARDGCRLASQGSDDPTVMTQVSTYAPRRSLQSIDTTIQEFDTAGTLLPAGRRDLGATVTVNCHAKVQWLTPIQVLFGGVPYDMNASASMIINY